VALIATCIENRKHKLPTGHFDYFPLDERELTFGQLEIGQVFFVCGVMLLDGGPRYLLQWHGDEEGPIFAPSNFFRLQSPNPVTGWYGGHVRTNFGQTPVLGYLEFATKSGHFEGLVEYKDQDIDIFVQRTREMRQTVLSD
tara:strand:+ start:164 stop:586 length:423 start_codon:yes stop_codon:yes gene_type:complete